VTVSLTMTYSVTCSCDRFSHNDLQCHMFLWPFLSQWPTVSHVPVTVSLTMTYSVTCSCDRFSHNDLQCHMFLWPFLSQWPTVSPLQNIDLSSWNPLYIFSIVIHIQPVCMASVDSVYWRHILQIQQDSCALCLSTTKGQSLYSQQPRGRVYFF